MEAREIKDIRRRVDRANARGVKMLIAEEATWRAVWPPVLVAAVVLNIIFAAGYLAHVAPPDDAPPVVFGMNWSALQNWIAAAVLIVATRIVSVFAEDATDDDDKAALRWKLGALKVALVAFSIFTAAMGVSLGIQAKMDQGAAVSATYQASAAASDAEREAVMTARGAVAAATRVLDDTRGDWSKYKADADAMSAADRAWLMRPAATAPYLAAIERAERGSMTARAGLDTAQARLTDAIARQGEAVTAGGSEKTQLAEIGSWAASLARGLGIPVSDDFRASSVALAFGIFVAVLLEWVCVGGQSGAAAAKRAMLREAKEALDDALETVRAGIAPPAPEHAHTPTVAPVQGRTGPYTGDNVFNLATRARHSDAIAEALADARTGRLASATFGALRDRYGVSNEGAELIRAELVKEALAVPGPAGQLQLINKGA